jgi:DNA repair photolyase
MIKLHNVFSIPAGFTIDIGKCLNGCVYCYSNFEKTTTTFKQIENMLEKKYDNTLLSYYIENKYPIVISNGSDINHIKDEKQIFKILDILKNAGFPIYFETKGSFDVDFFESVFDVKKDVLYITLTTLDDSKRKLIEPFAPSVEKRIDLIERILSRGGIVEVGINPAMPDYFPEFEACGFIENHKKAMYVFSKLHLKTSHAKYKELKPQMDYNFKFAADYCKQNGVYATGRDEFTGCRQNSNRTRDHFGKEMIISIDVDQAAKKCHDMWSEKLTTEEKEECDNNFGWMGFNYFWENSKHHAIDCQVDLNEIYPGRNAGKYFRAVLNGKVSYKDYIKILFDNPNINGIGYYSKCYYIKDKEKGKTFYRIK